LDGSYFSFGPDRHLERDLIREFAA
jgi:hypothetical protein